MKVKCKATSLSKEQEERLRGDFNCNQDFHISINKIYLVLGISFTKNGCCIIEQITDYGHLASTPLFLFDIIDAKVSKYWEIKKFEDGTFALWPPSFYKEFYHDDLSEDIPEIVSDFKNVVNLMESERKD